MKKIRIILLVIMVISFSIAGFIFITASDFSSFNEQAGSKYTGKIGQEKTFSIDKLNGINIDNSATDIHIIPTNGSKIKVHFYGTVKTTGAFPELKTSLDNGILTISTNRKQIKPVLFYSGDTKLDLYIPKTYNNNLSVKTISAGTFISGLNIREFNYQTDSGDLHATALNTRISRLKSISGQLNLDSFSGDIKGYSSSGDIFISYHKFTNKIELKSISGNARIKLPSDAVFQTSAKSTSGSIEIKFPITLKHSEATFIEGTVGDSKNEIKINTSSGDIDVTK